MVAILIEELCCNSGGELQSLRKQGRLPSNLVLKDIGILKDIEDGNRLRNLF